MSTATTGPVSPGGALPGDASSRKRHPSLEDHDVFVEAVRAECRVPGAQQELRRALGKPVNGVPARTHAVLLRNGIIPDGTKGDARRAHYAVAALIAARPRAERVADQESARERPEAAAAESDGQEASTGSEDLTTAKFRPGGTSLGESLALATIIRDPDSIAQNDASDGGSNAHKVSGLESRLHLMTRQDVDGIHRMLPGLLRQLGSAAVPVDYACLLKDLIAWHWYRDSVTTRWLTDYYRTLNRERAAAKEKKRKPGSPDSP